MKFQYREIGCGDWMDCSQHWYDHCQKSPLYDTRVVAADALEGEG
jgi:hypothetical protein